MAARPGVDDGFADGYGSVRPPQPTTPTIGLAPDLFTSNGTAILISMDRGDQFTEGAVPDEPGDEPGPDLPLRGWVDPDDRLWLHPSEMAKLAGAHDGTPEPSRRTLVGTSRRGPSAWTLAGTIVVVAALAAMVARLPVTSGPGTLPASTSLTTAVVPAAAVRAATARLDRSLVGLMVTRGSDHTVATAAVMDPGNLAVTGLSAVAAATSLSAVTSAGKRLGARVLATDPRTGIAVVRLSGSLQPARFADDLDPGQLAMTACVCQHGQAARPRPTVDVARVQAVGVEPPGRLHILDSIEVDGGRSDPSGAVLADGSGHVAGILDGRASEHGAVLDVFVPGWLASAVGQQLATEHRVVHGWLGVTGRDAAGSCGAQVTSLVPGTPADRTLAPGDVIVSVDGKSVCTWAQLQASLYVLPPDQVVHLEVDGPTGARSLAVALSPTPT